MNATTNTSILQNIMAIVPKVFDILLGLQATATTATSRPAELVSGAIGINGDRVNGTVYVHLPESLAH